jgi:hypothetical protein
MAGVGSLPAPSMPSRRRSREKGKKVGERRADRRAPHGSDQEERWMAGGPAGCVGPKGMVGCGLGKLERAA